MSSSYEYQPFYNEGHKTHFFRIPFNRFAWVTVSLPFLGFLFCVVWSVVYEFDNSTSTHCHVFNVLPSISAAIGSFSPQREVWQWAIGLHAIPRFVVAFMYKKYHTEVLFPWAYSISTLTCALNVIENICLIGLSFWTSSENYPVHKTCFVTFIITSELYMILTCLLFKRCRKHSPSFVEIKSLDRKVKLVTINVINILLASYCFMRHNSYCETGVYSLFAFFEYIVVLSNMAFHMTAYWDFFDRDLVLSKKCKVELVYR